MNTTELEQQLTLQYQYTEQLLSVLKQENSALVERDIAKIVELAANKQQILQHLAQADQQISTLVTPDNELPVQFAELKQSIINNIAEAQRQNEINGKAIALSLGSIERLQQSLIRKRAGTSMTYNEKGKTRGSGTSGGYISV